MTTEYALPRRVDGDGAARATDRGLLVRWSAEVVGAYVALTLVWTLLGLVVKDGPVGWLRAFDDRVATSMVARRTPGWDDVAFYVAHGADTWVKIGATALLAVVFWFLWRRWHEVLVLAVSLILEASVFITVTTLVKRPRPAVPQLEASPVSSSFPSGHTAAAAVYAALAVIVFWHSRSRLWRAVAVALSALAPVLIGTARVYQGMHHISDVVAGAVLGFVTVAVVAVIVGRPPPVSRRARRAR